MDACRPARGSPPGSPEGSRGRCRAPPWHSVNRSPVSCIPSPESPAKRTTIRSFSKRPCSSWGPAQQLETPRSAGIGPRCASSERRAPAVDSVPCRRDSSDRRPRDVGDRLRRVGGRRHDWGPNESDDAVIAAMRADRCRHQLDRHGRGVRRRGSRSGSWDGPSRAPRRGRRWPRRSRRSPRGSGFRPEQVQRRARHLARLDTDGIDLYQLHWPDERTPGRGDLGRHGGTPGRPATSDDRRLELRRQDQHRAVSRDPPRGFPAAGVLDAEPRQRGSDPLVR